MARAQNKSGKTVKKSSSDSVLAKKGGKVQKKLPNRKSKKKVESQVKQALKTQVKESPSQAKAISTSNLSRRNSRSKSENNTKSSTSISQHATTGKISSPTKASTSKKTGKVQAASKIKSNLVEQPEIKRRTSTKSSIKSETLPTDNKNVGNQMSLRGKKRSYAELASGNKVESSNEPKKRKNVNTNDITSQRNRSIKPTVKGSEWRNTILQKKSTGSKQNKTVKKAEPSPLKNKSSSLANKSPKQTKKSSPRNAAAVVKSSKTNNKKSPVSKRPAGGRDSDGLIQKLSPSKGIVQKADKINTGLKKSPNPRSSNRKSSKKLDDFERKNSNDNTLQSSIKNKFNFCVTNKRQSRSSKSQENVLVAQGILHDILDSVGMSEIPATDEKSEDQMDTTTGTSDLSDSPVKIFDQDEACEKNTKTNIDVLSESANTVVSETKSNLLPRDEVKSVTDTDEVKESAVETNCHKHDEPNSDCHQKGDNEFPSAVINVDKETPVCKKDIGTQNKNNQDDTLEDIELHLSDTSATSLNGNESVTFEIKSTVSSNTEQINETGLPTNNCTTVDCVLSSEINSKEITMNQENKLSVQLQNEMATPVNGVESYSDAVSVSTLDSEKKESLVVDAKKKECSQQSSENEQFSTNKKVSLPNSEVAPAFTEVVLENSNYLTNSESAHKISVEDREDLVKDTVVFEEQGLEDVINYKQESLKGITIKKSLRNIDDIETIKKDEESEPTMQIKNDSSYCKINCNSSNRTAEEYAEVKEIPRKSMNPETDKIENCNSNKTESDKKDKLVENQNNFTANKKETLLHKKESTSAPVKENSSINNRHHHSLDNKVPNNEKCNIELTELKNDQSNLLLSNGDESNKCDKRSQKSVEKPADSVFKGREDTCSDNAGSIEILDKNKEIRCNDITVGNVKTSPFKINECLQPDEVKLKETSSVHIPSDVESVNEVDKQCLEIIKECNTNEAKTHDETSHAKSKISEKLSEASKILSHNKESNNISFVAQKVSNDLETVGDKENPVKERSVTQQVAVVEHIQTSEVTSCVEPLNSTESINETVTPADGNSKNAGILHVTLKNYVPEIHLKNPPQANSVTVKNDSHTGQFDNTKELNVRSCSSTDRTGDVNKVTSSSSHEGEMSVIEKFDHEDLQVNNKTENSTNLTEDISKVILGNLSGSLQEEELNSNGKNVETSFPSYQDVIISIIDMPADVKHEEISEESLKMEEGNQKEITQDSIIVDDTDGESMQCNSETQSSNRMSVDEETPVMEVDCDEAAVVSASIETKTEMDGEVNMEVS